MVMSSRTSRITEIFEAEPDEESDEEESVRVQEREFIKIHVPDFKSVFESVDEVDIMYRPEYAFSFFGLKYRLGIGPVIAHPRGKNGLRFHLSRADEYHVAYGENVCKNKLVTLNVRDAAGNIAFTNVCINRPNSISQNDIGDIWPAPNPGLNTAESNIINPQSNTIGDGTFDDGKYTIEISAEYIRDMVDSTTQFIPENPICKGMLSMFLNEKSSDIRFEFKTQQGTSSCHAHFFILEACAPYLAELCGKHDNSNPFPIGNVQYEIFHQLLFYVYGGKINETFYETNSAELIDAADKYGVTNLKLEAEVWHVKLHDITLSNVVDSLLWADSKHLALVKEQVMNFVMENKKDVITLMSSKDSSLPPSILDGNT